MKAPSKLVIGLMGRSYGHTIFNAGSLSDDLHEEVRGDLRVERHGGGELAEGLDLFDGDCARIHGNLVGEGLGDLVVGNATEQK